MKSKDLEGTIDSETLRAHLHMAPEAQASETIVAYNKSLSNEHMEALVSLLEAQVSDSQNGSTALSERMLISHAHSLNMIFNKLARDAVNATHPQHSECQLKLALRAQSQCRATLETLSEIKNPRVAGYVQQANITSGPQQVNNLVSGQDNTPRAENQNLQNELLEYHDVEWMDGGEKSETARADSELAPVGKVYRRKNHRR